MIAFLVAAALSATPVAKPIEHTAPMLQPAAATAEPVLSSVAVTLECTAFKDGHVGGCQVLGETHPGLRFGDAAIALMQGERMRPAARDVQFARTIQFMP